MMIHTFAPYNVYRSRAQLVINLGCQDSDVALDLYQFAWENERSVELTYGDVSCSGPTVFPSQTDPGTRILLNRMGSLFQRRTLIYGLRGVPRIMSNRSHDHHGADVEPDFKHFISNSRADGVALNGIVLRAFHGRGNDIPSLLG